jgi:hypothetical protein
MTPEPRRIPDALLERYLADALSAEAKARLETTLAASPGDQARLADLRADSAAFLLKHPPGPLVARFEADSRPQKWWQRHMLPAYAFGAVGVALMLSILIPRILIPTDDPFTVKGSVVLVLHRKQGDGSVTIPMDGPVAPHDAIRFEVKGAAGGFVAVLSRDSQGATSVYYPFGGSAAAPFDAAQALLPDAIELDDTLGREDLYVLHSTKPFDLKWALQALGAGRSLKEAAPADISVGHASFVKVPRH